MSTYNPIIESTELRRVRVGAPLQTPAIGSALVLERSVGGPIVIGHGDRVPEPRLGNYRRMYLINVAACGIGFSTSAPSQDHAFPFTVTVRFSCQVTNPVAIARNGITDMTAALSPSLTRIVREEAARYDVDRPAEAEFAINARLNAPYPTADVELTGFTVFVSVPDTAEIMTRWREQRVERMDREHHKEIAKGGRESLIHHALANGADPLEILDRHREDETIAMQMKLNALRAITGDTNKDVADKTDIHRQVMGEFFSTDDPAAKSRSTMRERLERRAKGSLASGRVVEGTAPAAPDTDATKDPAAPTIEAPTPAPPDRPNRVRGSMGAEPPAERR
jgi:hypothetical protein